MIAYKPKLGDRVLVKTASGEQREVRVAGFGQGVVYVTTEAEYELAHAEGREPIAYMGFPVADVVTA